MYIDILHTSLNVPSPNISPMIFTATPSGLIQGAIKKFCSTAAEAQKRPSDMGGSSCGAPGRNSVLPKWDICSLPQNIGKTQCFETFLPFRAPAPAFFWLFLFSDLLSSSLLFSSLTFPTSAFSSVHIIVRSLTSKLPSANRLYNG